MRAVVVYAVVSVSVLTSPAGDLATEEVSIVTDINLGEAGSYPSYLLIHGDTLYFRANNISGGNNTELWRYDGRTAEMVADISPGFVTGSPPAAVTASRSFRISSSSLLPNTSPASLGAIVIAVIGRPL